VSHRGPKDKDRRKRLLLRSGRLNIEENQVCERCGEEIPVGRQCGCKPCTSTIHGHG